MTCYACKYKADYGYDSLKWMSENNAICDKHEAEYRAMKAPDEKVYKLKPFLPPVPQKTVKNFQDREPGEEG